MAVINEKDKSKWTKDKRHWYFYTRYIDEFGKKKAYYSKMYANKNEALEAENEYKKQLKFGTNSNKKLFNDIVEEWLYYKKQMVKSSTYYGIYNKIKNHIITYFENIYSENIKILQINKWREHILALNISTSHMNKIIGYMQEILKYAVENHGFNIKVASKLQKIKEEKIKDVPKDAEINYWTFEEFNKFIKSVDNDFYYTLFNFMYYTGLRYGEMNALSWNDIDLEKKTLKVSKNLTNKLVDGGYAITTPKTNNSNRIVELDDNLINLLKKHLEIEKKIYNFNNDMFIFGNVHYIPATTFRRNLNHYINIAKVKRITTHGFRHSHASLLINLGCDSRDVAERLGDTVQMVEKTYYHMFPEKKKTTVELLNKLKK